MNEDKGRSGLAAALVALVTVVAIESMSVATIMPIVSRDLGGLNLYGWAFAGFALGQVIGIVSSGQWADRAPVALPLMSGLGVYGAGLAVSALAPTMLVVVLGRVLQGYGAGAVPAVVYVAIGRAFDQSRRPRIFAYISTAWVAPSLVGPLIAERVADLLGWRWVFGGLVPIVAVIGAWAIGPIRSVAPAESRGAALDERSPLMTLGWAALTAAGVAVLLSALGSHAPMVRLVGGAVGAIVTFFGVVALTPAGTVRAKPGLPAVIATRGMLTFAFFGADAFVTLGLAQGRKTSVLFAGIVLSSASFTWTAGSWLQARLAGSWSHRRLVTTGLSFIIAAILGFGLVVVTDISTWVALPIWLFAGFGMGLAYAPLAQAVLILAPPERAGSTTAALQFSDVIGVAIGAGLGGVFVDLGIGNGMRLGSALMPVWGTCAAVAGVGLWASRRMPETGVEPNPTP